MSELLFTHPHVFANHMAFFLPENTKTETLKTLFPCTSNEWHIIKMHLTVLCEEQIEI